MTDKLDQKILQMHAALESMSTDNMSEFTFHNEEKDGVYYTKIDFSNKKSQIELYNMATLLIANIACLKDHLKVWCKNKSITFEGEALINNNKSVAIIHDLWNIDKHGNLSTTPRSTHTPKLDNLTTSLVMSIGNQPNSSSCLLIYNNKLKTENFGTGTTKISVDADILDENNHKLGDFITICQEAVETWEKELLRVGVKF